MTTKTRPIIMGDRSVLACLQRKKTQTRRVMKPQPIEDPDGFLLWDGARPPPDWHGPQAVSGQAPAWWHMHCPYGFPGDRLYVKEKWRASDNPRNVGSIQYHADGMYTEVKPSQQPDLQRYLRSKTGNSWRSPMFMPKWARRLELEVQYVGIQRLQSIREADAVAEGFGTEIVPPMAAFYSVWDELNDPRGFGRRANPWVWVIEFEPHLMRTLVKAPNK